MKKVGKDEKCEAVNVPSCIKFDNFTGTNHDNLY